MGFFKFLFKNKPTHTLGNRLKESGNVFMMLFGAVAMVGVIGASTMTVMKGPVRTMSQVTKRTIAENNMIAAGKLALIAATTQADNGDCDSDGMIEPIPYAGAIAGFTGGGSLPATIGVAKEDPWGNEYAYCVWDHGDSGAGDPLDNDANCGGSTNFLAGGDVVTEYALAIISAGPDRHFDTTCVDFVAPGTPMINKTVGKDDLILGYTYGEASALSAGLWNIESGDPDTAEITKDLSVKDGAFEAFTLEAATGNLALGVGATGSFPSVQADFLSAYNNANIVVNSPISSSGDITTTADVSGVDLAASGTLGVSGISTLGVVNSGNTGITGTLGVSGISTLGATNTTTLTSSAGATLNSLGVTNGASIGGDLSANGNVTLGDTGTDTVTISGNTTMAGTLGVGGTSTLKAINATGQLTLHNVVATNPDIYFSAEGLLASEGAFRINIDSDNDSANEVFLISKDSPINLATEIFKVSETGDVTVQGKILNLADPTLPQDAATMKYVLDNIADGTGYTETDPQVDTLVANKWCTANAAGDKIDCNVDLPGETDPQVGTLTAGRWCTTDGTDIDCTTDPATGLAGALAIDDLSDGASDATSVFLGAGAGAVDDGTANNNTAVGINTLNANTSGYSNTASGFNALNANTTGNSNTAIGNYALNTNITGTENTATGNYTLYLNTGSGNTGTGTGALGLSTSGNYNTGTGTYAIRQNTTGSYNTASGFYALYQNAAGNRNTATGYYALRLNTGDNNIAIGAQAGDNITTGSNNLILGYNIDAPVATADNQLNIGNILFGSGVGTTAGSKIGAVNYCDENLANCFLATDVGGGGGGGSDNLGDHTATQDLDMASNDVININANIFAGVAGDAPVAGISGGSDNLGSHTATQALNMNTFKITGLGAPAVGTDAATKTYVDAQIGGAGDDLGDHTATTVLKMGANAIQLGTANLQTLLGDNSSALTYDSNHSTLTQMIFRDKENTTYGRVYGSGDGATFGLLDGDGHWSYLAAKDAYTAFKINNINEMVLYPTYLHMQSNQIRNVADPTLAQDAATKAYVDTEVASAGDNLGNHTATANLLMGANDIRLGTSNLQKLSGSNDGRISYTSNSSGSTSLRFMDKESSIHGAIYGDGDGAYFGLLDGDNNWSYQARKDVSTSFFIDNTLRMIIENTGHVGIGVADPTAPLHVEGGNILNRGTGGDVIMRHGASYGFIGTSTNTDFGLRTNNIDRIRIENSGNVGIGVAGAASQKLEVNGNVLATAYFHSSDRRLKKNIETVSGLELISKLRGVTYDWKKDGSPSAGVIAQEIEKVLPRAVKTDDKGMKSVDYDQIIAPLIEAVKELKLQNEALSARIKQLEEK